MAKRPVSSLRTHAYDELRKLLRETREAVPISQEELSERLGRPITYMGKIELGTRRLDPIELMDVLHALGKTYREFAGLLEDRLT